MPPNNRNQFVPSSLSRTQKIILIIMGVAILVALIAVAYLFSTRNKNTHTTNNSPITVFGTDQAKARDVERETDIKTLHSQVEAYYAEYGYYPSLADMNDSSFLDTYLKGLDMEALRDPSGSDYTLASSPTKDKYSYAPKPDNCDNSKNQCTTYTLTATLEEQINGSSTFVKNSLN